MYVALWTRPRTGFDRGLKFRRDGCILSCVPEESLQVKDFHQVSRVIVSELILNLYVPNPLQPKVTEKQNMV